MHFAIFIITLALVFDFYNGSNDAQKTIGIITVVLFTNNFLGGSFYVPYWVILLSYSTIALGTMIGVGSIKGFSAVRWGVARNILWAWILTIPLSAIFAMITYYISVQLTSLH